VLNPAAKSKRKPGDRPCLARIVTLLVCAVSHCAVSHCAIALAQERPTARFPADRANEVLLQHNVWQSTLEGKSETVEPVTSNERVRIALADRDEPVPATDAASPQARPADNERIGTTSFVLAAQPAPGTQAKHDPVQLDGRATQVPPEVWDFSATPVSGELPYDSYREMDVYQGKSLYANRRPLVELGRPWYQLGQLPPPSLLAGSRNPLSPQFLVYGDFRTAYASNDTGADSTSRIATALNLNFDLRLTSTERFTMFMAPFQQRKDNLAWLLDEDRRFATADAEIDFGMFEGDLGAIVGGPTGQTLPFDLPFAVGVIPLLFQNGTWMDDAVLGAAVTIPARNSAVFDVSNMDTTFFAGFDKIDSDAFPGDDSAAKLYGMASWLEARGGYLELNYAFLEDRDFVSDRSYHNIGVGWTRRYGRLLSSSARVMVNAGQESANSSRTADGVLLLLENSLITSKPSTFVPYFNLFAGFDRPQSVARGAFAGEVLRNTGILFESDFLTGYPTLDATANDAWGGAFGLNILTSNFDQQLVLEVAALQAMGSAVGRNATDDQYGAAARYQIPLNNAWILRMDGMYGFLRQAEDLHGLRMELRHKF
jgi:hypothetical protein